MTDQVHPEITVQADIGGFEIRFNENVFDADEATINKHLDLYHRTINRQRAKIDLGMALADLADREGQMMALPEMEKAVLATRAEERARIVASFDAQNAVGRRSTVSRTPKQQQDLVNFDAETAKKRQEFVNRKAVLEVEIPALQKRVQRCRDQIAGKTERHEALAGEVHSLPEAAD